MKKFKIIWKYIDTADNTVKAKTKKEAREKVIKIIHPYNPTDFDPIDKIIDIT